MELWGSWEVRVRGPIGDKCPLQMITVVLIQTLSSGVHCLGAGSLRREQQHTYMLGREEVLWVHTSIHAFCSATQTILNDARVHTNAGKQQCALSTDRSVFVSLNPQGALFVDVEPMSMVSLIVVVKPVERSCFSDGKRDNAMYVEIHFISPCPFSSLIDQHVCANYVISNTIGAAPGVTLTIHDKTQSFLVCSSAPPVARCIVPMSMPIAYFSLSQIPTRLS